MNKALRSIFITLALSIGAHAGNTSWYMDAVPHSMEIISAYTSTGVEAAPQLIVYFTDTNGQNPFAAPIISDKERGWADMIRTAIANGNKINVLTSSDYYPPFYTCDTHSSSGACVNPSAQAPLRILRVAMKP